MWRYLASGLAVLLMAAAGWVVFSGHTRSDAALPAPQNTETVPPPAPLPATMPEATERTREQKRFDRYDKDRDQRITREEYFASRRKAYAKLDANGDGRLSFDEWAVKTTGRFAAADRDRSGSMDGTEFATTAPKRTVKPRCACPPSPREED